MSGKVNFLNEKGKEKGWCNADSIKKKHNMILLTIKLNWLC